MTLKFNLVVFILLFIDDWSCPLPTTPQLPKNYDKLPYPLKLTMYKKKPAEIVVLGEQFCKEAKFNSAIKLFDRAIKIKPSAEYYVMRGECYTTMGRYTFASADFKKALQINTTMASVDFDEAMRMNNKNAHYRQLLSEALFKDGEFSEAIQVTIPLGISAIVSLGNKLYNRKKYTFAQQCYSEAILRTPQPEAQYYKLRGLCYKAIGSSKDALEDFREAFKKNPEDKEARSNLTSILLENEEYEEALPVAFGMDAPELSEVADKLYYEMKFQESIRCYSELIIKESNEEKYYERRGFCYWRTKELELAMFDYEEALKMKPDCTSCSIALLDIYCDLKKYIQASAVLEKLVATKLPPNMETDRILNKARKVIMETFQKENKKAREVSSDKVPINSTSIRIKYPDINRYSINDPNKTGLVYRK